MHPEPSRLTIKHLALFVVGAIICGVYSLAARGDVDNGGYVPYAELSDRAKAELEHYAGFCVLIDGEIWSNEVVSDRERQTRKLERAFSPDLYICKSATRFTDGFPDPYEQDDAPIYYPLAGGEPRPNTESIQKAAYHRAVANIPGAMAVTLHVTQVVDGGVLCDDVFVAMDNTGLAEDSRIEGVFQVDGTYEYTTVLGAPRTIRKLKPIGLDLDTRVYPVTGEKLYDTLVRFNIRYFPIYRPRANILSRPTFRSQSMGAGKGREYVASAGNLEKKGEYTIEWEEIRRPLSMR